MYAHLAAFPIISLLPGDVPAKFIILNTKFFVFNTQFLVFNTKSIIFQ